MARKNIFGNFIGNNAKIGRSVIIINGKVVSDSSNVTVINGKVVSGKSEDSNFKSRSFDEKKVETITNIETIKIRSFSMDVSVTSSEEVNEVEAHLYGEACVDGNVDFDTKKVGNILFIKSEIDGCCFNSNLKLNVTLPSQFSGLLHIETTSADITVEENVKVSELVVKATSGDLTINADFYYGLINTTSGDIDFCIEATHDIAVKIGATSGDISAEFGNIKYFNISASSCSGDVRNRHKPSYNGYTATGQISTTSGDIRIR